MEDYASNSHKSKSQQLDDSPQQEKRIEKIVSGAVTAKKKTKLNKLTSLFIPEDVNDVKAYVMEDVIVPAIKDIILDTIQTFLGIDKRSNRRATASKISYQRYYDNNRRGTIMNEPTRSGRNAGYDYNDVVLETRGDAEAVLTRLDELIDEYGMASVADLYDLCDLPGNYTDNKYGWTNIRNASVQRVAKGYLIKLPRAEAIN